MRALEITELEPSPESAPLDRMLNEIFAGIPSNPDASAARVMRLSADLSSRQAFFSMALRYTIAKVDEVHYYKYLAALIEDVPQVSPEWQARLLAAAVYYLKGPANPEPVPMQRAREALRALTA